MLEFAFRYGREPCTINGHLCVYSTDELECLLTDQFSFRIEVRCNRDAVGIPCQFLEEGDDLLLGRHFDGLCIDQAPRGVLLAPPVLVARLEIDLHHVSPESYGGDVPETVGRDTGVLVLGDLFALAQYLRNTAGRYVLFRNDQVHGSYAPLFFSASASIRFSVPGSAFPRVFFITCPTRKLSAPVLPVR